MFLTWSKIPFEDSTNSPFCTTGGSSAELEAAEAKLAEIVAEQQALQSKLEDEKAALAAAVEQEEKAQAAKACTSLAFFSPCPRSVASVLVCGFETPAGTHVTCALS